MTGGDVVPADAGSDAGSDAGVMSADLGPRGGTLALPDGTALEIPSGALGSAQRITVRVIEEPASLPEDLELRSRAIAFEPHGQRFAVPVTLRLPFTGDARDLTAVRLDDEDDTTWESVDGGTASAGHVLELRVSHFSIYAVASAIDLPDASVEMPDALVTPSCATDNGGCGDPAYVECVEHSGAEPSCEDIDECAAGVLATCGAGATECSNLPGDYSCTCDAQHVGSGSHQCAVPSFCQPLVPLAGETCYDFTAHGVSSPSDTSGFTVGTGESISAFYFDVPWTAGTLASRLGFVVDAAATVADAWLYDTGSNSVAGTVARNITGTLLGEDAAMLDHWGPGGCELALPADVGLHLPSPGRRIMLVVHYYNTTGSPQPDGSAFRVCTVAPASRAHVAGLTILGSENLGGVTGIAPGMNTYSGTCTNDSAAAITLVSLAPHGHALAVQMKATVAPTAGGMITVLDQPYDSNYQLRYEPGSSVIAPGDQITTSCTYVNGTGGNVLYGLSLQNELCYVLALAYPYGALDNGVVSLLGATNTCW